MCARSPRTAAPEGIQSWKALGVLTERSCTLPRPPALRPPELRTPARPLPAPEVRFRPACASRMHIYEHVDVGCRYMRMRSYVYMWMLAQASAPHHHLLADKTAGNKSHGTGAAAGDGAAARRRRRRSSEGDIYSVRVLYSNDRSTVYTRILAFFGTIWCCTALCTV
jgi:hypothetical protein